MASQTQPASTAIVETIELLEQILLRLPGRDILKVKRVAKSWQHLIESSVQLLRAAFLRPKGSAITMNSQLSPTASLSLLPKLFPTLHEVHFEIMPLFTRVTFEPFVKDTSFNYATRDSVSAPGKKVHRFQFFEASAALTPRPAAMRGMYLTEPPVTSISLGITGVLTPDNTPGFTTAWVHESKGVKMGTIIDLGRQMISQIESSCEGNLDNAFLVGVFLMS